jgi:beta-aspartyl-peptidase (threonine type)
MIVLCSGNGGIGIDEAWTILRNGGSALDAVEAGTRLVESNAAEDSVGMGGLPNILGEVQADASIMDGRTLHTGAVAAVRGCEHVVTLARLVMERLPHVLLAGDGAERFAREMGLPWRDLLTEDARAQWREHLRAVLGERQAEQIARLTELCEAVWRASELDKSGGTVNFIAQDQHGDIACAVSTSGWAWKYPGRVGDSPIIGAGNYADNRYGAAACCGIGELAIRACTAHSAVLAMRAGKSPRDAGREALLETLVLPRQQAGMLAILVLSAAGVPAALTTTPEIPTFWVCDERMAEPEERECEQIPIQ